MLISSFKKTAGKYTIDVNYLKKIRTKRSVLMAFFLLFILLLLWTQPDFNESGTTKIWDMRNNTLLYESAGIIGKKFR